MKKVLFIVAALIMCVSAQAQIVSSRSSMTKTEKAQSESIWYVRAGVTFVNMAVDGESPDANTGYNVMIGWQDPMGAAGAYWGMEWGFSTRGYKIEDVKAMAHAVQYSPFTFGWRFNVGDKIAIDPHLGLYAGYDFSSSVKYEDESYSWDEAGDDYTGFDAGMNIGVGVWFGRFNLDVTYQKGFIAVFPEVTAKATMIRLGIAF